MRFGVAPGRLNPHFWTTVAERADELGFHFMALPEHLVLPVAMSGSPDGGGHPPIDSSLPVFDVWVYIGFLAARTSRIRFGSPLGAAMQLWELAAREAIRDTIARYAQAGDRLMIEEMAGTFCEDGVLETGRDHGTWVGRTAIAERLSGGRGTTAAQARAAARSARAPGQNDIQRHLVSTICFDEVTPRQARVSSYFTVLTSHGLDHFGRYRDLLVPVGDRWLFRHRVVTRDWERP